ncbi:hypothetical protein PTKIN_Ptkin14bG0054800 [Pterospermum kingtungense]
MANRDRFIDLSECLLRIIIIYFHHFKDAARTSVLSKLWLNVWRTTTNMEFEESFFVDPEESDATRAIKRRAFVDFAREWVGNYRYSSVDKFGLTLSNPGQFAADVESFIAFALAKNAKRLSLVFSEPTWVDDDPQIHEPSFDLPSQVYSHGVLESLVLFSCKINVSAFENLSLLKELSLGWIELTEKSIKNLLEHCPLLESLRLTKCWNIDRFMMTEGHMEKLKKLVIDKCSFHELIWNIHQSFFSSSVQGKVASFDLDYLRCMQEVHLDFGLEESFRTDSGDFLYSLLLDLFSVTVMTICSFMLLVIPHSEATHGTEFPLNVRHLKLKTALHSHEFWGIKFFLNSCPLLQTLLIDLCPARVFQELDRGQVCNSKLNTGGGTSNTPPQVQLGFETTGKRIDNTRLDRGVGHLNGQPGYEETGSNPF